MTGKRVRTSVRREDGEADPLVSRRRKRRHVAAEGEQDDEGEEEQEEGWNPDVFAAQLTHGNEETMGEYFRNEGYEPTSFDVADLFAGEVEPTVVSQTEEEMHDNRRVWVDDPTAVLIAEEGTDRVWVYDKDSIEVMGLHCGQAHDGYWSRDYYLYDRRKLKPIRWTREMLEASEFAACPGRAPPSEMPTTERLDMFFLNKSYGVDAAEGLDDANRLSIYLTGVNRTGESVTLTVRGFKPYMYVRVPNTWKRRGPAQAHVYANNLYELLNQALARQMAFKMRSNKGGAFMRKRLGGLAQSVAHRPVVGWNYMHNWKDIYTCKGKDVRDDFVRLDFAHPALIVEARKLMAMPAGAHGKPYTAWYWDPNGRDPRKRGPTRVCLPDSPNEGFAVYEGNVDYVNRFLIDADLKSSSWITVNTGLYQRVPETRRVTSAHHEFECLWSNVRLTGKDECFPGEGQVRIIDTNPSLLIGAFDAEMVPNRDMQFPTPVNEPIVQMSYHAFREATGDHHRYLFTVGHLEKPTKRQRQEDLEDIVMSVGVDDGEAEEDEMDRVTVYSYETEQEMLTKLCEFIQVMGAQLLSGWNSNNYDLPYLVNRCRVLGLSCADNLGLMADRRVSWRCTKTNHGTMKTTFGIPGVISYDLMYHIRELKQKFKSSALAYACEALLDITKLEFSYSLIRRYQQTATGRYYLAAYCNRDVEVLIQMIRKERTLIVMIEESAKTNTPIQELRDRGSLYKIFMTLLTYTRAHAVELFQAPALFPVIDASGTGYKGATVLDPTTGYYNQSLVGVIDFASLYPSIMRAHNLCFATLLREETITRLDLVEGRDYTRAPNIVAIDPETKKITYGPNGDNPAFATPEYQRGLVPLVESELFFGRKCTKRQMGAIFFVLKFMARAAEGSRDRYRELLEKAYTPEMRACSHDWRANDKQVQLAYVLRRELDLLSRSTVDMDKIVDRLQFENDWLDARQLAEKIIMNSIYGFFGCAKSKVALLELAFTVTTYGRWDIAISSRYIKKYINREHGYPFDAIPIYGDTDSVFMVYVFPERWTFEPTWPELGVQFKPPPLRVQGSTVLAYGPVIQDELNRYYKRKIGNGIINVEFEKMYWNLLLAGKKCYAGLLEDIEGHKYVDIKGLKSKRRDCSKMLNDAQRAVIKGITSGDVEAALQAAADCLIRLQRHEVPLYELRQSCSISKYPEEYDPMPAGPAVALKNQKRTGKRALPGDRISYVITTCTEPVVPERETPEQLLEKRRLKIAKAPKVLGNQLCFGSDGKLGVRRGMISAKGPPKRSASKSTNPYKAMRFARKREVAEDTLYAIRNGLIYDERHYVDSAWKNFAKLLKHCLPGGEEELRERLLRTPEMRVAKDMSEVHYGQMETLELRIETLSLEDTDEARDEVKQLEKQLASLQCGRLTKDFRRHVSSTCKLCKKPLARQDIDSDSLYEELTNGSRLTLYCRSCVDRGLGIADYQGIRTRLGDLEKTYDGLYQKCVTCTKRSGITDPDAIRSTIARCEALDCSTLFERITTTYDIQKAKKTLRDNMFTKLQ